jgi:hypothetical protein
MKMKEDKGRCRKTKEDGACVLCFSEKSEEKGENQK